MNGPILELRGIAKAYGALLAVADLSIRVARGEFLSLLGPSGSGKTTTLMMIAGLLQPSAGEIFLDSRPVTRLPPYKRNVGLVFQNYALFPHMTVERNIAFPLRMRDTGRDEIDRRVGDVLRLVGLPEHGRRFPKQLSGGQQQRVALARAMVFEPPILLMDEPLGALDKKLRGQMQLEIKRLHRQLGMSIVYVTHDQEEALVMSDRIAVFNMGRLEQIGNPVALYERPATRFVAEFLGDSNIFQGTATAQANGFCVLEAPGLRLRAIANGAAAPGTPMVVAVRPERIRLSATAPIADAENVVAGRIAEIVYLGQSRKYVVRTNCGADVVTVQQARSDGERDFDIGAAVCLNWRAEDATVLHDPAGTAAAAPAAEE